MKASARAAGYSERSVYDVEKSPAVQKAIEYFREQNREEVRFELADAHHAYERVSRVSKCNRDEEHY